MSIIQVRYSIDVLVDVDTTTGAVEGGAVQPATAKRDEEVFRVHRPNKNGSHEWYDAVVAKPPPKFTSMEEAEEWMETHKSAVSDAITITQEEADRVLSATSNLDLSDFL